MKVIFKEKNISNKKPHISKKSKNKNIKLRPSRVKNNVRKLSNININDLPLEILEKIIGNIHIWHRNRIRLASKTLKYASDTLLLHELKMKIEKSKKNPLLTNELVTMKALHQATWAFAKKGFGSIFLGKMLGLLRCHYYNKFAPTLENCKKFLKQFYELISEKLQTFSSREARLLYVLIMLGYFRNIRRCEKMFSEYETTGHWQIIYILHGSWFKIYACNNSVTSNLNYLKDGNDILIVLFCLMTASYKYESFKNVHQGKYKTFLIGHDSRAETSVKTFIILNVYSSKNIFDFLLSAMKNERWNKFPNEEFQVEVEIFCRQDTRKNFITYKLNIDANCEEIGTGYHN